jgi:hypothetical protein
MCEWLYTTWVMGLSVPSAMAWRMCAVYVLRQAPMALAFWLIIKGFNAAALVVATRPSGRHALGGIGSPGRARSVDRPRCGSSIVKNDRYHRAICRLSRAAADCVRTEPVGVRATRIAIAFLPTIGGAGRPLICRIICRIICRKRLTSIAVVSSLPQRQPPPLDSSAFSVFPGGDTP